MADGAALSALQVLRVVGALVLTVGLVLLAGTLMRRTAAARRRRTLAVEERLQVARGVHVVVVRAGERRLVLGVADKHVSLVTELAPEVEAVAAVAPADEVVGTAERAELHVRARPAVRWTAMSFAATLAAAIGRRRDQAGDDA